MLLAEKIPLQAIWPDLLIGLAAISTPMIRLLATVDGKLRVRTDTGADRYANLIQIRSRFRREPWAQSRLPFKYSRQESKDVRPYMVRFVAAIASSGVSTTSNTTTGPRVSSFFPRVAIVVLV